MAERWAEQAPATPAEALEVGTRTGRAPGAWPVLSVVLPLLLLLAGAAGAYFAERLTPRAAPTVAADEAERRPALFYDLPEMRVALEAGGRDVVYRLAARVALADETGVERLEGLAPRLVPSFRAFLGALRPRDLDGIAGLERVREELRLRLAAAIHPAVVRDVSVRRLASE